MKLHHLRTAFLVICLLLVCSQGRSQNNNDGDVINDTINNNVVANFTNTHINTDIIINTDPAVPEPTTLSLLAMSLLFAGRRWR